MPPLRDRPADIIPLAQYFASKYAKANGVPDKPFTPAALGLLQAHHWRGNVREIENTMHRSVLLAHASQIDADAIMLSGASFAPDKSSPAALAAQNAAERIGIGGTPGGPGVLVGRTVADVERDLILDTLNHCLGNRTHAANILGISIRTLRNKLKLYNDSGVNVPLASGEERAAQ
jgi:DNA-binding NtrC family response regulator